MNGKAKILIILFCLGAISLPDSLYGQQAKEKKAEISAADLEEYKEKIKQMVSFLQFTFNALGDTITTTREKETIINQSYLKVFRDDKVIIEDDLVDNRAMAANKNVQAYLKDIDFFFRNVKIEFDIQEIEYLINEQGRDYFKVTLNRILNGISLNYDTVTNVQQRFIEINLNEEEKDLRIASIYTTRLSLEEEYINWWHSLSPDWQSIYRKEIGTYDSVDIQMIRQVAGIEKLDISNNPRIVNLEGISKLENLRELDVSNTAIDNLLPLRNLTRLRKLNASNTRIADLEPLKYSVNLEELYCNDTEILSLQFLENLQNLKVLHCEATPVNDIEPIKNLQNLVSVDFSGTMIDSLDALDSLYYLRDIDISETYVVSLEPLKGLKQLERLDFSGSQVRSAEPLKGLPNLKIVQCNSTPLNSIEAFNESLSLERIYCDNTLVTRSQANEFMAFNPNVLVIFKSDLLKNWWSGLNDHWKEVFVRQVGIANPPNKEELASIAKMTAIDLSDKDSIHDLSPVAILENLMSISFANAGINDLSPLQGLEKLEYINCSFNPIKSLQPLSFLRNLRVLNIESTEVDDLSPLSHHGKLELMYCDDVPLKPESIQQFTEDNQNLLVIYKTDSLVSWWNDLGEEWTNAFERHLKSMDAVATVSKDQQKIQAPGSIPSREDLHRVANLPVISIQNNSKVTSLEPLLQLPNLRSLQVVNTRISDLTPIANHRKLRSLDISYNPVRDLSPIRGMTQLVYLNIANTPIESLDPIAGLKDLEEIDCSGTQVKNLNALGELHQLKEIDFSNTSVRSFSPIEYHINLVRVSCFNTRLTPGRVDKFRKYHPEVEVRFY